MAKLRLASPLQQDSIVDGLGIRMVLWTQGCRHHCAGCHNPQTWDEAGGTIYEVDHMIEEMKAAKLQTGLTLSGGEPFLQAEELIPVAKAAKELGLNVWAYSGFTIEELFQQPSSVKLLAYIDVLVDGKFQLNQKDYRLKFKGSRNQRIIDVQATQKKKTIVLSTYDDLNRSLTVEV